MEPADAALSTIPPLAEHEPTTLVWIGDADGEVTEWLAEDGAVLRTEPGVVVLAAGEAWRLVQDASGRDGTRPRWAWRSDRGGAVSLPTPPGDPACDELWSITVLGSAGSVVWWEVTDDAYCGGSAHAADPGGGGALWGAVDLARGVPVGPAHGGRWQIDPRTGEIRAGSAPGVPVDAPWRWTAPAVAADRLAGIDRGGWSIAGFEPRLGDLLPK